MRNYVRKTESFDNSINMRNNSEVEDLAHRSRQGLDKVVASLTLALLSGTGFILDEVRDKVNEIMHPNQAG